MLLAGLATPRGALIGLDTCLAIMEVMRRILSGVSAVSLGKKYIDAGYLRRKSGRGFYGYRMASWSAPTGARAG